jgi:hypothetical protein
MTYIFRSNIRQGRKLVPTVMYVNSKQIVRLCLNFFFPLVMVSTWAKLTEAINQLVAGGQMERQRGWSSQRQYP